MSKIKVSRKVRRDVRQLSWDLSSAFGIKISVNSVLTAAIRMLRDDLNMPDVHAGQEELDKQNEQSSASRQTAEYTQETEEQ